MKRIILCLFLLSVMPTGVAEDGVRTIRATSEVVDIRVGEDYYLKGGWRLDPQADPDVFSIGSKWLYSGKEVTFITDLESISFYVDPGNTYDFVVMLDATTPCHIQIRTMANPIFMTRNGMLVIGLTLLVALVLVSRVRKESSLRYLLYLGVIAPIAFWLITLASAHLHGSYVHHVNTISELGAIGTDSELFASSAFALLSILCLWFSVALYKTSKRLEISVLPALFTFGMPLTFLWTAVFSLGNEFHSLAGPVALLTILGPLLAFLLWPKNSQFRKVRTLSLIAFLVMLLLALRFIDPLGSSFEGLVQRFFYLGWSVWFVSMGHHLASKLRPSGALIA